MNLKDFKEWLNQFPDDTIVEVSVEYMGLNSYYSEFRTFDKNDDDHYTFIDLNGNPHVAQDNPNYNKRFLQLGSN